MSASKGYSKMLNPHFAFALVVLTGLLTSTYTAAQQKEFAVPENLTAAIKQIAPSAVIIKAQEVDATACHPVGEYPGLVRADLNGDGREDFAALLKTKETGKVTSWEGKTLRETRFLFVLFIDDGGGGYKPRVVRRYTDFVPTAVVIDLQPPGKVRHRETHKDIQMPNAGVTLSFCEKSAMTYYMSGDKIRSVPIAD